MPESHHDSEREIDQLLGEIKEIAGKAHKRPETHSPSLEQEKNMSKILDRVYEMFSDEEMAPDNMTVEEFSQCKLDFKAEMVKSIISKFIEPADDHKS